MQISLFSCKQHFVRHPVADTCEPSLVRGESFGSFALSQAFRVEFVSPGVGAEGLESFVVCRVAAEPDSAEPPPIGEGNPLTSIRFDKELEKLGAAQSSSSSGAVPWDTSLFSPFPSSLTHPDMPRWPKKVVPPSKPHQNTLPLRPVEVTVAPVQCLGHQAQQAFRTRSCPRPPPHRSAYGPARTVASACGQIRPLATRAWVPV